MVSDGNLWFYAGFGRFLKPNVVLRQVLDGFGRFKSFQTVPELTNHSISLSNRCPVNHFGAQGVQEHQSFQTISFHYQIDAIGSVSELKALRAPEALLFIIKSMPREPFRNSARPEAPELPNH